MVQKADRDRIKALLTEAITVLCKNGLGYKYTCAVEGLLGITLDEEEIFLVNINETIAGATKRPTPEQDVVAKPETGSPAGGSPAGTPKRRRRRSNSGGTDSHRASPAKRANYGSGEEQQQQQQESDVIVIKEEVSQEEFSDFYGDTGDGQDDNSQYALQQQQADQYGAGCSQWDTSQTQGGQSDWPAFNPTQQQQHAISQAASSAMLSPSQGVAPPQTSGRESTQAAYKLTSPQVRKVLTNDVVRPVLANGWAAAAFRMHWNKGQQNRGHTTEDVWTKIAAMRAHLDQLVCRIPGVFYVVSAINATNGSVILPDGQKKWKINPGVHYWVVSEEHLDCREVTQHMETNSVGAAMKLLLQPFQKMEKDLCGTLFNSVKDNMGGCVRRMVEESQTNSGCATTEAIVKFYVAQNELRESLPCTITELNQARFYCELYEI